MRFAPLVLCSCVVAHEVGQVVAGDDGSSNSVTTGISGTSGPQTDGSDVTTSTETTSGLTNVSATMSTEGGVDTASDGTFGETSEMSTGVADPYAVCGVELEFGGPAATWRCQCESCDLVQENLTPQSRDDFLGACVCLCDASDCGASVTGSETSGGDSSGSSTDDTGTTAASSETDASSSSSSSTG